MSDDDQVDGAQWNNVSEYADRLPRDGGVDPEALRALEPITAQADFLHTILKMEREDAHQKLVSKQKMTTTAARARAETLCPYQHTQQKLPVIYGRLNRL